MSTDDLPTALSLRIVEIFGEVPNPRTGNRETHGLVDILTIAVCAMISGADEWTEMAAWGQTHEAWLRQYLELEGGIPSPDTFGRVFRLLNPRAFDLLAEVDGRDGQPPRWPAGVSGRQGRAAVL